jgi:hypothetical protein
LFPQIYAQALRGLGKHTKDAAVLLTAAIGGGAVFPPIMYGAMKSRNLQYAFCVIVAAYVAGILFPIWLNAYPTARALADPCRDEQTRRDLMLEEEIRRDSTTTGEKKKRWSGMRKRLSASKESGQLPTVEHRERSSWPEGRGPIVPPIAEDSDEGIEGPSRYQY